MSFVFASPDAVAAAAQDLANLHSTLSQASATAAAPTAEVAAAAEDQVSAAVARFFGAFGQDYQTISAETQAFHQQFVNLMNAGANAYSNVEAANVQQMVSNAVNAPAASLLGTESGAATAAAQEAGMRAAAAGNSIAAPYESLLANTSANIQSISNTWANVTEPAVVQAITTQFGTPQQILASVQTGNLAPLLTIPTRLAYGAANVIKDLTVPVSLSITSVTSTNATVAVGVGLPQLLAFDALGAPVNAALAVQSTGTAFFGALQAGNSGAAVATLIDAPAYVANAFLNGEVTLPVGLPLPGSSAVAEIPFGGLLAPLQPLSGTASVPGSSLPQTVTITGPPVGGLVPGLVEYGPQLLASAFGG